MRITWLYCCCVRLPALSCCDALALALAAWERPGIGYLRSDGMPNCDLDRLLRRLLVNLLMVLCFRRQNEIRPSSGHCRSILSDHQPRIADGMAASRDSTTSRIVFSIRSMRKTVRAYEI